MTNQLPSSLRIVRCRVAMIDANSGAPKVGTTNGLVIDSQIQVQLGVNVTTGANGNQKNGDGVQCSSFQDPDVLDNITLSLQICKADSMLAHLLAGETMFFDQAGLIGDAGAVIGSKAPPGGTSVGPVCFEAWTRAWNGSSQLLDKNGLALFWHWVFPWTNWVVDQTTLDTNAHIFPYKAVGKDNPGITINGPFNDWPSDVTDDGGVNTSYGKWLESQTLLPTASSAFIPVPGGS